MSERRKSSVVQVDRADDGVIRVNDDSMRKLSNVNPAILQEFEEAKAATAGEHELTIRDAIKLYPKAIIFSIIFSSAVIMEGYDLSLTGSFFGFPPFRNYYGRVENPNGEGNLISAPWQSGIQNGVQVGFQLRCFYSGYLLLLGRQYHWSLAQRYRLRALWLQEGDARVFDLDDRLHLPFGLRAERGDHSRRINSLRVSHFQVNWELTSNDRLASLGAFFRQSLSHTPQM